MILQGKDTYRGPSFTLSNRLGRAIWNVTYILLFKTSPRPFHFWRVFLLRVFGAKIGPGFRIYPSAKIWAPWNLQIGHHSGVADHANLYSMDKIIMGDFVAISEGAFLCCGSHDYNSVNMQLIARPIVIGTHAWICAEAFLHPGVVVPEGAVVGARSVVTKSLPLEWAVYTGNPCKQVALRTKNPTR
jgi:putative colanic acid biosynthesis acetyltransferase WcaF